MTAMYSRHRSGCEVGNRYFTKWALVTLHLLLLSVIPSAVPYAL